MTDLEYIAENLSDEDILCQIAEEAAELSKAALKLRRALTGTNPTPVSVSEAQNNLIEEYGDVLGAFLVLASKYDSVNDINTAVNANIDTKYQRWAERIKEAKENDTH